MKSQHVEFPELTPEAAAAVDAANALPGAGGLPVSPGDRRVFAAFLRELMKQAYERYGLDAQIVGLEAIADNLHSPPPPPPTLAEARAADLDTPAGRDVVRDFLATLGEGAQL
jgi:hypothetical protein